MIAQRKRWIGVVLVGALVTMGWFIFFPNNKARSKAERLRQALHAQGFKTDLGQFDFRVEPQIRARAQKVLAAGQEVQDEFRFRTQGFFRPVGSNAAVILSDEDALITDFSTNGWVTLQRSVDAHHSALDEACAALVAGPIRFEILRDSSGEVVMQYLTQLRGVSGALGARTLLGLHEHRPAETWTNLLALTRLASAWDTEPLEIAHLIKFNFAASAARMTWEAQRLHALNEAELAALGREWTGMKIWEGLPATAELSCALTLRTCESQRDQVPNATVSFRQGVVDFFDSPQRGWSEMTSDWRQSRYRKFGSYEDEVAAMKFYSARARDLRAALQKNTWAEVRANPALTNNPVFQGVTPLTSGRGNGGPGNGQGFFARQRGLVLRAAEAEGRRRLVCTALAIEAFYLERHEYPGALGELKPGHVLSKDFMDGQSLRYRKISPQDFLLYSTGPDCVDDGGVTLWDLSTNGSAGRGFYRSEEPDMLWPRVASADEALAQRTQPPAERRRFR